MLPFPNMPYGPAPAYAFPLFEGLMYLLFVLCMLHAIKKGASDVSYLVGGLLFGLMLEYINVVTNMGYVYGKFVLMFGKAPKDIPLCIGVGWGIIMYTARLFTDTLGMKLWASVASDTLLAISIDLSMDTVAYRLHMWHWNWADKGLDPLTSDWFGIPYGNFFGWVCVVFFYSAINRLLETLPSHSDRFLRFREVSIPLLSVILSQILLYAMLVYINAFLKEQFGITSKHRFVFALIVLFLLLCTGLKGRKSLDERPPYITWLVPVFCHVYFFSFLFIGGFYRENLLMVAVAVVLAAVSVTVHTWPLRKKRAMLNGWAQDR